jgi:hypothetical protein
MAFLNATPAAAALRIGRLPTSKGGWTIDEDYLTRVRISVPDDAGLVEAIWARSDSLIGRTSRGDAASDDREQLDDLVCRALGLDAAVRRQLDEWARAERPADA